MTMPRREELWVLRIKREGEFPESANLLVVDIDGQPTGSYVKAAFFQDGRLGTLHGGLLSLADYRERMTDQEVADSRIDQLSLELERRRPCCESCVVPLKSPIRF